MRGEKERGEPRLFPLPSIRKRQEVLSAVQGGKKEDTQADRPPGGPKKTLPLTGSRAGL